MDNNIDINHFIEKELKNIIATLSDTTLFERIKAEEMSINKTIEQYRKHGELEFKQEQNKIMQRFSAKSSQVKALIENLGNEKNFNVSKEYAAQIEDALKELISKIEYEQDNEIKILKERLNIKVEKIIEAYKEKIKDLPQKRIDEITKIIDSKSSQLKVLDDYYETASFDAEIWQNEKKDYQADFPILDYISIVSKQSKQNIYNNDVNLSTPEIKKFFTRKSISVFYNSNKRDNAKLCIDSIILRSLMSARAGNITFNFVDLHGNGGLFLDYLNLPAEIYNNKIITTLNEAEELIVDLQKLESEILQTHIKSLDVRTFNQNNPKAAIPYRLIIIDNFPKGFSINIFSVIERLIRTASKAGIHFVFIVENGEVDKIQNIVKLTEVVNITNDVKISEINSIKSSVLDLTDKRFNAEKNIFFEEFYNDEVDWWTESSATGLSIPLGMKGANDYSFVFDMSSRAHAVIAGQTGCGKSYFLHTIITSACLKYSPNELKVFLIDLKSGVEFQRYASHKLPHADFIALHGSPEFGIHILKHIVERIDERSNFLKEKGAKDIFDFKNLFPDEIMPRFLIVIDEYQEMFRDRSMRSEAIEQIDKIAKQGRSFGFNLLLASQTVELPDDTLSNFGIRICMRANMQIARRVLDTYNDQTPKLKAGQAIISDGDSASKVQSFFLQKDVNIDFVKNISNKWQEDTRGLYEHNLIVFDRESKANLLNNQTIKSPISENERKSLIFSPGEKILIDGKDFVSTLNREKNNNIIVLGGKLDISTKALNGTFLSFLPQLNFSKSKLFIFNYINKSEKDLYANTKETITFVKSKFKKCFCFEQGEDISKVFDEIIAEIEKREQNRNSEIYFEPILLSFFNIENNSNFHEIIVPSTSPIKKETHKKPELSEKLITILDSGPELGIHCIIHSATTDGYYNVFSEDEDDISLFNNRILLQMSEEDSKYFLGGYRKDAANLVDKEAGKESMFNRAIYYDNYTQRFFEIIKPYELLNQEDLNQLI
jgi:DNA segregation ATPase FtsK/SpoIIIE, S-DNA-T family